MLDVALRLDERVLDLGQFFSGQGGCVLPGLATDGVVAEAGFVGKAFAAAVRVVDA